MTYYGDVSWFWIAFAVILGGFFGEIAWVSCKWLCKRIYRGING